MANEVEDKHAGDHRERNSDRQNNRVTRRFFPSPFGWRDQVFVGKPFGSLRWDRDRKNQRGQSAIKALLIFEFAGAACPEHSCAHGAVAYPFFIYRRAIRESALPSGESRRFHIVGLLGNVASNQA